VRFATCLLAGIAALAPAASAQMVPPTYVDVAYGPHPLEKLDVYVAFGAGPRPVLVEVHPGGWAGGTKSNFGYCGDLLSKIYFKGITVVSINYPVAPQDPFPTPNISCQRAIQFLRSKALDWNLDPNSIATFGTSSGGHLAAWVAMAPDAIDPASPDPILHYSSRVRALLLRSAPSDLTDDVYKYDPSIGHGSSPAWVYFAVANEAQYLALPKAKKQAASPRWLCGHAGVNAANQGVAFLGINYGDPKVTSSSQLSLPEGDLHALVQGMLLLEELRAIGNPDATLFIAPDDLPKQGVQPGGDFAAEWLTLRFQGGAIRNQGLGVAGCDSTQMISASSVPLVGNANFAIHSYDAYPGSAGCLLVSDLVDPAGGTDWFGVGLPLLVNPATPSLIAGSLQANAGGFSFLPTPIPNNPFLHGSTFYAQEIWVWPPPAQVGGCVPSPFQLSATNLLVLTIP
jgi:BD-FAE protein